MKNCNNYPESLTKCLSEGDDALKMEKAIKKNFTPEDTGEDQILNTDLSKKDMERAVARTNRKGQTAAVNEIEVREAEKLAVYKTAGEIYEQMKKEALEAIDKVLHPKDRSPQKLTAHGKKFFLFPHLAEKGFDTWDKIVEERFLIMHKASTSSLVTRSAIDDLVVAVNARLQSNNSKV